MAGFSATTSVDPLDYDFRPYVEAHGTIPEPSSEQMRAFLRAMRELTGAGDDEGTSDLAKRLEALDETALEEMDDRMFGAIAALTKGTPSVDDIKGLPVRGQRMFVRWLMSEMQDPNSSNSATKN